MECFYSCIDAPTLYHKLYIINYHKPNLRVLLDLARIVFLFAMHKILYKAKRDTGLNISGILRRVIAAKAYAEVHYHLSLLIKRPLSSLKHPSDSVKTYSLMSVIHKSAMVYSKGAFHEDQVV